MKDMTLSYDHVIDSFKSFIDLRDTGRWLQLNRLYEAEAYSGMEEAADVFLQTHLRMARHYSVPIGVEFFDKSLPEIRKRFIKKAIANYRLYNGQWYDRWSDKCKYDFTMDIIRSESRTQIFREAFMEDYGDFPKPTRRALFRALQKGKVLDRRGAGWVS